MGDKWWAVIPITFLLAGCSTVTSNRINNLETKISTLETKVDSIEQRQSTIEGQNGESRESVGYLKGKVDSRGPSTVVVTGAQGNEGYLYKSGKESLTHKDIQLALKNAGFYNGHIDGKIGKSTKKAIKEFQKANDLKADGVVGKDTKEKLAGYLKAN
ncbi:MAG: peptidoglycan-binding protein [Candidatus Omnitrophica bacterium]|nr:peptidoglycan-binding protein [Candidatus Omnitrophota bacterium]